MRALLLGPECARMTAVFAASGDVVVRTEDAVVAGMPLLDGIDMLVSFGYRHIIRPEVLALFPGRAINLHIALLPWNRGADPNLWSFLDDTPKGVTIHQLDAGIDTGDILAQREVHPAADDTLRTSYERLRETMLALFSQSWGDLRCARLAGRAQPAKGTFHRLSERQRFAHLLAQGWDTPVAALTGKALSMKGEQQDE